VFVKQRERHLLNKTHDSLQNSSSLSNVRRKKKQNTRPHCYLDLVRSGKLSGHSPFAALEMQLHLMFTCLLAHELASAECQIKRCTQSWIIYTGSFKSWRFAEA